MSMVKTAGWTVAALTAGVLAACGGGGGGGDGSATKNVDARVAYGAVQGATCTATEVGSTRTFTASGTTSASGDVTFRGLPENVGPLIVSCTGGTYFDEATGTTKSATGVKSVLPAGSTSVAVTPLSTLVAVQVEKAIENRPAGSTISNAQITAVANSIAAIFAPGVDLLAPPRVVSNANELSTLVSDTNLNQAEQYAIALAALSKLVADNPAIDSQDDLIDALAADLADNTIGNNLPAEFNIPNIQTLTTNLDSAVTATSQTAAEQVPDRSTSGTVQQPTVTPPSGTGGTGGSGGN